MLVDRGLNESSNNDLHSLRVLTPISTSQSSFDMKSSPGAAPEIAGRCWLDSIRSELRYTADPKMLWQTWTSRKTGLGDDSEQTAGVAL